MSIISITKLYDLLTAKLGRETAENLTLYIEDKIKGEVDNKSTSLATKEDIAKLDTKISESKSETIKYVHLLDWPGPGYIWFYFDLSEKIEFR